MSKLSDSDQLIVDDYFEYTILEMQEGMPKYILEEVLQHYLDLEDYLACAGIKKGLDWYDTNSFVRNLYIIDEIIDKNE
mgnify:FL=1|tara:strand:+ start:2088 stop:2324 length:237 start_codon:yes stop_codon:yes gene_type:complete